MGKYNFVKKKTETKKYKQSYFGSKRIFMKWPFLTVELYKLQIVNWHWFKILDFKLVRGE